MTAPFAIAAGVAATWRDLRRDRPACVAGFGGYPALPAMVAAGVLKVPTLIHEQNGVLGRVNRHFAPKVDVVACGIWPTAVPEGRAGGARRQPGARRGARPRGRHLHRAGRLSDGAARHRRQPGRGALRAGGAGGAGAAGAGAPRAAAAQPAGAARGHGPGAGGLRADGARGGAARLLRRRAGAAGRGDAGRSAAPARARSPTSASSGGRRSSSPIRRAWTTTRRRTPPGWFPPAAPS